MMENQIIGDNLSTIASRQANDLLLAFRNGNRINRVGSQRALQHGMDSQPESELLDTREQRPNHTSMNTPSREEIDAKLETIEARMDGRVAAIQASIDGFLGRAEERALRTDDRFGRVEESLRDTQASVRDTQASIGNLKTTVITTAIATVVAIVLGVAAFNATVLSNMVASFESGKNTAASQAEVKRQSEETAALLKQLQQQLEASRSQTPPSRK